MNEQSPPDRAQTDGHHFSLLRGAKLFEFEIDRTLGHGGFGITYLAIDTLLQEPVAIKEYLPNALAVRTSDSTVCPMPVYPLSIEWKRMLTQPISNPSLALMMKQRDWPFYRPQPLSRLQFFRNRSRTSIDRLGRPTNRISPPARSKQAKETCRLAADCRAYLLWQSLTTERGHPMTGHSLLGNLCPSTTTTKCFGNSREKASLSQVDINRKQTKL